MNKGTIFSVDDDEGMQTVLAHYLEAENYDVITANKGADISDTLDKRAVDVVLLDLMLPDIDGLSLIPIIRAKTQIPIIILSGKSDTTEKIVCLEMGADDYLTKPFEMRELAARIKAVMRRIDIPPAENDIAQLSASGHLQSNQSKDNIVFGDFTLDRQQFQLFKDEQSLEITTGEFQLLEALALAPNVALSREQLFNKTRDGEYDIYDRAIDIQIGRIRKKLGDNGISIIKTVRGIGYMFCPP